MLLHWVVTVKSKKTRQKRILEIVKNASNNLKLK
ncbi:YdeI/OmpD-associated family protein [Maribacter antarcticus]